MRRAPGSATASGRRERPVRAACARTVSVRAPRAVVLAAAVALALAPVPAAAGIERAGTTAANFLAVGSGVGLLGMGGAGLGLEGGLAAVGWNPATLARIGRAEVVFTHAALADQTAQEWAGLGGRLPFAGLKAAVTGLFQSDGTFEGRDALNNPTGDFEVSSMSVGVGVARAFGRFVTAGVALKYASEDLGVVRGSGATFDAGLQVRAGALGFGAAAQNVFGRMDYDGAMYGFPSSYGVGLSYDHAATGLRVALDMNFPPAYYTDVRGGVEWRWNDRFALRTGYRAELGASANEPLGGPTFGMGAGAGGMWFDYGYLVGGTGAGQHRIGITFQPGAIASLAGGELEDRARTDGYASAGGGESPAASKPSSRPAASSPGAPAAGRSGSQAGASVSSGPAPHAGAAPTASPPSATPVPGAGKPSASSATTSAGSQPAASPASSPRAPAPASAPAAAAAAAGPVATQLSAARPPSYTQRAKAARGASEASSSSRKAAAENAGSVTTRAPVAAAEPASATSKRDSTAAAKAGASAAGAAPAGGTPAPGAARPDSVARPAGVAGPGSNASAPSPSASQMSAASRPRPEKVRVKNRQTMADIAQAYGTSVAAIMMENNLVSDKVRPGQVLRLPRK